MSCSCIRISLKIPPKGLPSWVYNSDGQVYFDLPGENTSERFAKTKTANELNILGQITGDAVRGFSLPSSDKNNVILKGYGFTNAVSFDNSALLDVVVYEGSIVSEFSRIKVLNNNHNETGDEWEVELRRPAEFWKEPLAALDLCELDYGDFDSGGTGITDNWADDAEFSDGDVGFWLPLVHFGNWFQRVNYDADGNPTNDSEVEFADLRAHFHVLQLLRKAFCKIGWVFESPALETGWGRRLIAYLSPDLFGGPDKLQRFGYMASVTADYPVNLAVGAPHLLTDEVHTTDDSTDPNYDYGPGVAGYFTFSIPGSAMANGDTNYYFAEGFGGRYQFASTVNYLPTITIPTPTSTVILRIEIYDTTDPTPGIGARLKLWEATATYTTATTKTISLTSEPFDMLPHYRVVISLVAPGLSLGFVLTDSSTKALPIFIRPTLGQTIRLSSYIDCELNALDLFKGIVHALDGRIETDNITKTITLFSHKQAEMANGDVAEGFYKPAAEAIDISDKVLCDSRQLKINDVAQNRFFQLCFLGPDDEYVKSLGFTEDNPIFGRITDLGADKGLNEETTKDCNPFFEASAQILAPEIRDGIAQTELPVEIPAYWNNDERKLESGDLNPRLLYAFGFFGQVGGNSAGVQLPRLWKFEGGGLSVVPFAFQFTQVTMININAEPEETVIYGTDEFDLFNKFWINDVIEKTSNSNAQFLAVIDNCFYNETDFRSLYRINYRGQPSLFRMTKITDFRPCTELATPIEFIPIKRTC